MTNPSFFRPFPRAREFDPGDAKATKEVSTSNGSASAVEFAPHFGGDVKASLSVPSFLENLDIASGSIGNEDVQEQLLAAVKSLLESSWAGKILTDGKPISWRALFKPGFCVGF